MSNKQFILNGVTYYPTKISVAVDRRGKEFERADGSIAVALKAVKKQWQLQWNLIPQATLTTLVTLGNLTTAFPLFDAFGVGYSGIILKKNFSFDHDANNIATNGTEYFVVNLTVDEV